MPNNNYTSPGGTPLPSHSVHHDEYELVFQAQAVVQEYGGQHPRLSGNVRVIQGPKHHQVQTLEDTTLVYAFLSIAELNLPLLPDQPATRLCQFSYDISVPGRRFHLKFDHTTPSQLVIEFDNIIRWFCNYQQQSNAPQSTTVASRMDRAGTSGVQFVQRIGDRVQHHVEQNLDKHISAARTAESRSVPLGGRATANVLGGTRRVVGVGAGVASKLTERASDVVGSVLGNNPVMKNLRSAPQDSKRFRFHETLTSGMVAVGKVYVAADEKGRAVVATAGDSGAEILRERYGDEVAGAARNSTGIAIDGYRIVRFPAKFGASSLLKGALKAGSNRSYDSK